MAGFSLAADDDSSPADLARLLIAGLAERGEDACGVAWRAPGTGTHVVKAALPPDAFLRDVAVDIPPTARDVLVHVRDHTKGAPVHDGNNHPIVHGRITGVHNGIIQNDDELFDTTGRPRQTPGTTVDSEALFMLLDLAPSHGEAFPRVVGSYAAGFMDDEDPETLHAVRGRGRPLHVASAGSACLFASTAAALRFAARHGDITVDDIRPVLAGRHLHLRGGRLAAEHRIRVRRFAEPPTTRYDPRRPHAVTARDIVTRRHGEARSA